MPTNYTPIPEGTAVTNTSKVFNDRFDELDQAIVDLQGGGGGADEKAKVSVNDTTAGYLNGKLVAGSGITLIENNDGANETLTITATGGGGSDEKAKVSVNDTTAGYLNGKLIAGSGITLIENNDGANETLTITATGGGGGATPYAQLRDQKSQGTSGGNTVANTWTTHALQTETVDANNIVSITSNEFTPIAGTYRLSAAMSFYAAGTNVNARIRLYNLAQVSEVDRSQNYRFTSTTGIGGDMVLEDVRFTANGTDAYAIQYYATGALTDGLGAAMNISGEPEVYLKIYLEKLN